MVLALGLLLVACESKPKVIEGEAILQSDDAVSDDPSFLVQDADPDAQHEVVVLEALNTDRYTYLKVSESGSDFWIAVPRKEVKIGATYYYKGGLLKRQFHSQEFDRVFETLYLVSDIVPHPLDGSAAEAMPVGGQESAAGLEEGAIDIVPAEGAVPISELIANKGKYEGKLVKVTGQCVKVNPRIMGRNWVHLRDGSGENIDLTITTEEDIPVGAVVTLEGTIAVNKDFGAGYRYEVIMEDAQLR